MKTIQLIVLITMGIYLAGCTTMAPKELVNARSAYATAAQGPATKLAPAELHKAQEALLLAEKSFVDDSDSYKTRDLAYVAERKAQLAGVFGSIEADKEKKAVADVDYENKQAELVTQGKQDLSDAKKKTDDALAELAKLAALKEEERGLVLTLSGSILFRSNESMLLPSAHVKLDKVAHALLTIREHNLIVEGYTDSNGSDSYNQNLSQRRANVVRDYLVQRGYPNNRITTNGKGENSPIADNSSAEGRANNRRVEIVIERNSSINQGHMANY